MVHGETGPRGGVLEQQHLGVLSELVEHRETGERDHPLPHRIVDGGVPVPAACRLARRMQRAPRRGAAAQRELPQLVGRVGGAGATAKDDQAIPDRIVDHRRAVVSGRRRAGGYQLVPGQGAAGQGQLPQLVHRPRGITAEHQQAVAHRVVDDAGLEPRRRRAGRGELVPRRRTRDRKLPQVVQEPAAVVSARQQDAVAHRVVDQGRNVADRRRPAGRSERVPGVGRERELPQVVQKRSVVTAEHEHPVAGRIDLGAHGLACARSRGAQDRRPTAARGRGDGEVGGDALGSVDREGERVRAAARIAAPAVELVAPVGRGLERHARAGGVGGLDGSLRNVPAIRGEHGYGHRIAEEVRGDALGPVHRDRERIGAAAGVAAPAPESVTGGGRGGQRHARAGRVGGLIGAPRDRSRGRGRHGHGDGVADEVRGDVLARAEGHGEWIGGSARVAAPAREPGAHGGHRGERHRRAGREALTRGIDRDRARPRRGDRSAQGRGIGRERERRDVVEIVADGATTTHLHQTAVATS